MTSRRLFLKSSALAMFGVGAAPAWLSRALYAADAPSPRKKILVAIFQRGAVDGLNMVVPFGEKRYYESAAEPGDSQARRHRELRHRSRRLLRIASGARAAQAHLRRRSHGHRARGGLARSHALAFRRAGLHGIRDPGPQGDFRRLAEPGSVSRKGFFSGARRKPGRDAAAFDARKERSRGHRQPERFPDPRHARRGHLREHVRKHSGPGAERRRARNLRGRQADAVDSEAALRAREWRAVSQLPAGPET